MFQIIEIRRNESVLFHPEGYQDRRNQEQLDAWEELQWRVNVVRKERSDMLIEAAK